MDLSKEAVKVKRGGYRPWPRLQIIAFALLAGALAAGGAGWWLWQGGGADGAPYSASSAADLPAALGVRQADAAVPAPESASAPPPITVGPPKESSAPAVSSESGESGASSAGQPIVVGPPAVRADKPGGAASSGESGAPGKASSAQTGTPKSFEVPYQVAQSDAVEDSYFDDALFVGDSITTGIQIYGSMANAAVVASTGINPSTILTKPVIRDQAGTLHTMLETMANYTPGKIYILLGANGIGWIDESRFLGYYEELLDQISAQHPGAQIYVQSIFPVTMEKSSSENGIYSNEKIDRYNQSLMELCARKELYYLNVAQAFRGPDGALPADASTDGIHLIPSYYQKWFDYLKTHAAAGKAQSGEQRSASR